VFEKSCEEPGVETSRTGEWWEERREREVGQDGVEERVEGWLMERTAMWPGGAFVRTVWFGPESRSCIVVFVNAIIKVV
jgi:hypothetical protein